MLKKKVPRVAKKPGKRKTKTNQWFYQDVSHWRPPQIKPHCWMLDLDWSKRTGGKEAETASIERTLLGVLLRREVENCGNGLEQR